MPAVMAVYRFLFVLFICVVTGQGQDCPAACTCSTSPGITARCTSLNLSGSLFPKQTVNLEVSNIAPNNGLVLEDRIFADLGLQKVKTIQIVNSSLNTVHVNAFHGLSDLFDINLSDNQLILIHPDTFKQNQLLRHLSLSGNPLQLTQVLQSPGNYLLSSESIIELDLSRCHLSQIIPKAFSQLTNLAYINLASNEITHLDRKVFESLEFLDQVDLSNNWITSVDVDTFADIEDLTTLSLRNNSISVFDSVEIADLKELDLSLNAFETLTALTLEGVPDLSQLNFSHNRIEKIDEDALEGLLVLRYLDLSGNQLQAPLPELLLESNKELETLSFAGNTKLNKFSGFTGSFSVLYKLDISQCALEEISNHSFRGMHFISVLNLNGNALTKIPTNTFSRLHVLIELDVSNNRLHTLDTNLFAANPQLRKLNLAGNRLHHLPAIMFLPTTKLSELDLSHCAFRSLWNISDSALMHRNGILSTLEYLNLSGNKLGSLYLHNFISTKSLRTLDITNNPLKCDELFGQLVEWLTEHKVVPVEYIGQSLSLNLEQKEKNNLQWDDLVKRVCDVDDFTRTTMTISSSNILHKDWVQQSVYNTELLSEELSEYDLATESGVMESKLESSYIWPFILVVVSAVAILLALVNLTALLIYRSRRNYRVTSYKSAFVSPLAGDKKSKRDGGSLYHKLYEECSVPNTPIVKNMQQDGNDPKNIFTFIKTIKNGEIV